MALLPRARAGRARPARGLEFTRSVRAGSSGSEGTSAHVHRKCLALERFVFFEGARDAVGGLLGCAVDSIPLGASSQLLPILESAGGDVQSISTRRWRPADSPASS